MLAAANYAFGLKKVQKYSVESRKVWTKRDRGVGLFTFSFSFHGLRGQEIQNTSFIKSFKEIRSGDPHFFFFFFFFFFFIIFSF